MSDVEGIMALFDGYDRDRGSSAEIARVLYISVVLVVDAKSAAYSMAPLLQGFINFWRDVRIAGFIFNKVGSARYYQMLRQLCDDLGTACLGYLPKEPSLEQGSRYLGLDFSEQPENEQLIALLEQHIDWDNLLSLRETSSRPLTPPVGGVRGGVVPKKMGGNALIARNAESFSFLCQVVIEDVGETIIGANAFKDFQE